MKYDSRRPRQGLTLGIASSIAIYTATAVTAWGLWQVASLIAGLGS